MAAPKENQFWKLRSKHGRDKIFSTPELLWQAACEYFHWCDTHPWKRVEQSKSAGKPVKHKNGKVSFPPATFELPTQRPYTLTGFALYVDASKNFWQEFKKAGHEDFLGVISRIEDVIYTNKFEGAAVGAFNANIIARDIGLADKQEVTGAGGGAIKTQSETNFDPSGLSDDVLLAIAAARKPKS